jgi:hypothetical protein
MIADVTEAALLMPAPHVIDVEVLQGFGRCAMDDDGVDSTHRLNRLQVLHSLVTVFPKARSFFQCRETIVKKVDAIDENLIHRADGICLRFLP